MAAFGTLQPSHGLGTHAETVVYTRTVVYLIALVIAVTFGVIGVLVGKIAAQSKDPHETCSSGHVYCQRDQQAFSDRISPPQSQEKRTPQPGGGVTIHY